MLEARREGIGARNNSSTTGAVALGFATGESVYLERLDLARYSRSRISSILGDVAGVALGRRLLSSTRACVSAVSLAISCFARPVAISSARREPYGRRDAAI